MNTSGQVGDGTLTERHTPVTVYGISSGAVSMGIGYNHSCGMLSGNVLKCWGSNSDGQIGQADMTYSTTPRVVVFASANYTYGSSAHKHAVTALSSGESYSYDANGNMTTRVEGGVTYIQTFDAENRLISITAGGLTTQFIYDGDGNLVKKIKTDGSKTLYVGGIYEVDKNSGGTVVNTKTYYPAAGAMRNGSTLYYVLKDHLGSASVVTNSSGMIVGEDRFYPFSETRFTTGTMLTDKLYTGQREITGLGIYHYGARFYSPKLGRFLSADTIVPGFANPQNLNRFNYVTNNPLRYTDPTGHKACEDGDGQGSCLSEKQVTKKYEAKLKKLKEKSKNKNENKDKGPNPPLSALVSLAILFTVTTALVETGVVLGEMAMAPVDAAMPVVGIPLSLTLAAAGAAVLDLDIAFIVYTARVAENPEVQQEFEILPPWGLNK